MRDEAARERLVREELEGWNELAGLLDRIPPEGMLTPGAGPDDWSTRDVLYHLASWTRESADQLAAIRQGRYEETEIDTDARNAAYLAEGRRLDTDVVRVALERARARALAEFAAVSELSAPAVEWFGESGAEHYGEHLPELRRFVERLGTRGRPGAAARRAGIAAAEREGWSDIDGLVGSMPADALEAPGVTPDGWSVKDTMWHVAKWWEDFIQAVPRFADPAFDPDDETTEEVEWLNRTWFEESRELPLDVVRERWTSARAEAVEAFASMLDPSRVAEGWFEECGAIHYEKHLIDLRPWLRTFRA